MRVRFRLLNSVSKLRIGHVEIHDFDTWSKETYENALLHIPKFKDFINSGLVTVISVE